MDLILATYHFFIEHVFYGWTGEDVMLAIDPVTVVLVGIALGKSTKEGIDVKKKDELERKISKLDAEEKELLLKRVNKESDLQAKTDLIIQAANKRDEISERKKKTGILIGSLGLSLSIILIYYITKQSKK